MQLGNDYVQFRTDLANAEVTYGQAVSTAYVARSNSIATADETLAHTLAARKETRETALAAADRTFEHSMAPARKTHAIAMAQVEGNYTVAVATADRDLVVDPAFDHGAALSAADAQKKADARAAARAKGLVDARAKRDWTLSVGMAWVSYGTAAGAAWLAHVNSISTAEKTFDDAESAAHETRDTTVARLTRSFEQKHSADYHSHLVAMAQTHSSPWATHAASMAAAEKDRTTATSNARHDKRASLASAEKAKELAEAAARQNLANSRAAAKHDKIKALDQAAVDKAMADANALVDLAVAGWHLGPSDLPGGLAIPLPGLPDQLGDYWQFSRDPYYQQLVDHLFSTQPDNGWWWPTWDFNWHWSYGYDGEAGDSLQEHLFLPSKPGTSEPTSGSEPLVSPSDAPPAKSSAFNPLSLTNLISFGMHLGSAIASLAAVIQTSDSRVEHVQLDQKHLFHVYTTHGIGPWSETVKLGTVEVDLGKLVWQGVTDLDQLAEALTLAEFLAEQYADEGIPFGHVDYVAWSKKSVSELGPSGGPDVLAIEKIYKLGRTFRAGDSRQLDNQGIRGSLIAGQILADTYNEIADRGEDAIISLATGPFFLLGQMAEVGGETVKLIKRGGGFDVHVGDKVIHHLSRRDIRRLGAELKDGASDRKVRAVLVKRVSELFDNLNRHQGELRSAMIKEKKLKAGQAAHHLIPVTVAQNHTFTQRAALFGWRVDDIDNGMGMWVKDHTGGHAASYYKTIKDRLDDLERAWVYGRMQRTPEAAREALRQLQAQIRNDIDRGRLKLYNE